MPVWEKEPKKTIYLLNIGDFAPKIRAITLPLIEAYADKIRADIHTITERRYPEWPVTYEKLQIYHLAQEHKNDWNIYIDLDCLIHPDTPDLTMMVPRDTVAHFGTDFAPVRWKCDRYFKRDGRLIGSGNWLAMASDLNFDLWHPIEDLTPEEAVANIQPTIVEKASGQFDATHLIDDYALSRNISRFGLKFVRIKDQLAAAGYEGGGGFFYHHYLIPEEEKVGEMMQRLLDWKVKMVKDFQDIFPTTAVDEASAIDGFMKRSELQWLYDTAKNMTTILEIGCWQGRSTYVLCAGCTFGTVYAIDHFQGNPELKHFMRDGKLANGLTLFEAFMKNCGKFSNLKVVQADSATAAQHMSMVGTDPRVDMVFIDGDHSYEGVKRDIGLFVPRVKKIIAGHDYDDPDFPGIKRAVDEYFGNKVQRGPGSIWWVPIT